MGRRERWAIMGDILAALLQENAKGEEGRISNVAVRANVAYDRLQVQLGELEAAGLIARAGAMPRLTEKGLAFLRHYRAWTSVLEDFGLD